MYNYKALIRAASQFLYLLFIQIVSDLSILYGIGRRLLNSSFDFKQSHKHDSQQICSIQTHAHFTLFVVF